MILAMPYPEFFVAPMRDELLQLGIEELRSSGDVDAAVTGTPGTLMVVVNSVCGCAAGKARPGLALALGHGARPDRMTSVFAGFDVDATDRARGYFRGVMPSSPSIALLKDGQLVYMLERHHIEVRSADQIAAELRSAFDKFCSKEGESQVQAQSTSRPESPTAHNSGSSGSHVLKIQTRT
jgi:putative YphP/YqiW family bacilliredoxin